ncbi:flagellar assembly peptidoglycan hydrolase FlgJ [Salinicola rhizosphaerae]|uniref:Peptidoglycan hydrolase FlgJ n=1 Tax=Salinicola rhizosphaerae TaxID=1443141 RepID=A0ABQ3DRT6_9GAMM|nr:flagellar assembly peptidoglycan hydrolase FlgJ [Salinicola rhizosphaerae]GHB08588.1 flagellar rod assembly protein/muramidase FlgJ [Salinicola rhizosphaerae]
MAITQSLSGQFALDVQSVQKLKYSAANDPQKSLKEAARQFEAIFIQSMLKSMREATPKSGLMHSQQMDMMQSMQDQQWSQQLAGKGFGLADQLVSELSRSGLPGTSDRSSAAGAEANVSAVIAGIPRGTPRVLHGGLRMPQELSASQDAPFSVEDDDRPSSVKAFLAKLAPSAKQAEASSGVPAELILAQAALETGWGAREIPTADGGNSHNLFGIKAGSYWQGESTTITTTEYVDGRPIKKDDAFRVYDSYSDAFSDYANLIGNNPRYRDVVDAATPQQAAVALQRNGYATDPRYADKLNAVMAQLGSIDGIAAPTLMAKAELDDPYATDTAPTTIF